MPLLNRHRIIIIFIVLLLVAAALTVSSYFFSSSNKNDTGQSSRTATLSEEQLKNIKCQPGLQAPSVDSRACAFKDIAAAEIERRKLCNKEDARQALEIACQSGFKPPESLAGSEVNPPQPAGSGAPVSGQPGEASAAAVSSNCTPRALNSSERFTKNKSIACAAMIEYTADEFFKDPRTGCKSREEAMQVVKRACNGDLGEEPVAASGSGKPSVFDKSNPLANLINCTSIASASADLVRKQPSLCSSSNNIPREYSECAKEIVQVVTPVCLGGGQNKGETTLSGVTPNTQEGPAGAGGSGCPAAAKAIEVDSRACQFKDIAAQEISNRNLCSKEAARTALDQVCTSQSGAGTSGCSGAIVAKDAQFQANKELACGVGKSVAVTQIMTRSGSPCKTEADAARALDEACGNAPVTTTTGQGSQNCSEIAGNLAGILKNNPALCTSAGTASEEYPQCRTEIVEKVTPICVGSTSSTYETGTAECKAVADSLYATVRANTSLCSNPIPEQYKSCTDTILAALKPLCGGGAGQPVSGAKCDGATVAADAQFQQSKALACGVGRDVAIKTIKERSGSPCKTDAEAAKALDEACGLTTTPPSSTQTPGARPVCNAALVAANAEFQANKALACSTYKEVAIQKIMSQPGSPCIAENAARQALEEACAGNTAVASQAPSASAAGSGSPSASASVVPSGSTTPSGSTPPAAGGTEPGKCTCGAIAANAEFQQNKTVACANRDIAADQIAGKSGGACSKAEARSALDQICNNQCAESPKTTVVVQTPNGPVPLFEIQGGGSDPKVTEPNKCTCTAIAANSEFQQNSGLACQFKSQAVSRIVQNSNGACDNATAASELDKICSNQCIDTAGKPVITPKPVAQSGSSGGESACTCSAIASNPEFQQNSGLACQFKGQAVERIVSGSGGACDTQTAAAELDKICSNQCVDSSGQPVQVNTSGGGFFETILETISDIPVIGDIIGMFGGGGGGGSDDDDGFDFGEIIGGVVEKVGGFIGGFF